MKKNLILIELNEINFDILKKYTQLNNFKFFNQKFFENLKTTTSEKVYENLEPWIQWVSIHTGLSAADHKIFRLGDIDNSNLKQIFEIVESKGYQVGAICPMNSKNNLKNSKYFIPDPWTKTKGPKNYIQNLIYTSLSEAVNENSAKKLSFKSKISIFFSLIFFIRGLNFLKFLIYFFKSFRKKWYKAIIFDFLLHHIHKSYLKKYKVNFSTIFFNAGAHVQHHYLHSSKILEQELEKNPDWYINKNHDPIKDIYSFYDEILLDYLNNNYSILIATGLTQNPFTNKEYYYRLKNHKNFLYKLNINFKSVDPRMSRDFLINFENEHDCLSAVEKLAYINKTNDLNIFDYDVRKNSLFVILSYNREIKENFKLKIGNDKFLNLYEHVNFVALKNGKHDEKGFISSFGEFKKYLPPNNSHVKELFYSINSYFNH